MELNFFGETLTLGTAFFLVLAVGLALFFEAINGFHDTANAVATVIYTHSLSPNIAVIWSGMWNLIGVLLSSGAVAFTIVALLPVELVVDSGSGPSYAMVFSILVSAIIWNFGTWYVGLPNSSSHSLIGSIMGIGLTNSVMLAGHSLSEGINWKQVKDVFTFLLVSPIVSFVCAAALILILKALVKQPELFRPADEKKAPPLWIRALLILTCTGVSFAHGSNDGQKGMGLLMLILVGILPGLFALNLSTDAAGIASLAGMSRSVAPIIQQQAHGISLSAQDANTELSNFLKTTGKASDKTFAALETKNSQISDKLSGKTSFKQYSTNERRSLRSDIYLVSSSINKLNEANKFTSPQEKTALTNYQKALETETKFIPDLVKVAVALALGIGTTIGWKRIVVTVGEKIGKEHLSYGQGASAELVAMATITAADRFGLPVSTTHVLSSGIAGTMTASGSGLQSETLRNIALSWVLTLPACTFIGAGLFAAALFFVLNVLGLR